MKVALIPILCVALLLSASAQQPNAGTSEHSVQATRSALEAKERKAWEDYKNKNKDAFAAVLAEGFAAVEEDGAGSKDAKAAVAEIDQFDIKQYNLKDIAVKPLGADAALVTYIAEYSGTAAGQPIQEKDAMGEVWVKRGGDWKELYAQATKVK
jgi:hypothetical protein